VGFRFIVLTYTNTPTYPHTTHRYKVIAIYVPPFYVVGTDNEFGNIVGSASEVSAGVAGGLIDFSCVFIYVY